MQLVTRAHNRRSQFAIATLHPAQVSLQPTQLLNFQQSCLSAAQAPQPSLTADSITLSDAAVTKNIGVALRFPSLRQRRFITP